MQNTGRTAGNLSESISQSVDKERFFYRFMNQVDYADGIAAKFLLSFPGRHRDNDNRKIPGFRLLPQLLQQGNSVLVRQAEIKGNGIIVALFKELFGLV